MELTLPQLFRTARYILLSGIFPDLSPHYAKKHTFCLVDAAWSGKYNEKTKEKSEAIGRIRASTKASFEN